MRGGQGLVAIPRPRVLARMEGAPVVLLEAPGGYGKTLACVELAGALDVVAARVVLRSAVDTAGLLSAVAVATRRAGLAALDDAISPEEPDATLDRLLARLRGRREGLLLVVDEVQRADLGVAGWLAALADGLPAGVHLVVAGRRLGGELARLAGRRGVTALGVPDLRFDLEEVAAVMAAARGRPAAPDDVAALIAATEGWPAAVALAAGSGAGSALAGSDWAGGSGAAIDGVLRGLVDDLLAAADARARSLVHAVAELPLLSAEVLAAVAGDGALDLVLDAGLPLRFRSDGWGELPDPVREMFPASTLPPPAARAVADVYARRGELAEAAALLHRRGDHDGVVALLAGQPRQALERAGLQLLDAALAAVPDSVLAAAPEALVNLVRAAQRQPRLRRALLARAEQVLGGEAAAGRAIAAERAVDAAWADDLAGPVEVAEAVLAAAAASELITRGRAHAARARCLLLRDTAGSLEAVGADLEQAAACFRLAGEPAWEASAHHALGYGRDFTSGAFEAAVQRLGLALALRGAPDGDRAQTLSYLGEVLTHAGRLEDAEVALREAMAIGQRLGDDQTIAYTAWSAAELACQRRDRPAAEAAMALAEAHAGGWFERLAGVDFLQHCCEIRTKLGDEVGARRDLARAAQWVERAGGEAAAAYVTGLTQAARARLEATFGDPGAALSLLDALESNPLSYRRDRWLRLLLRAVCAARTGDAGTGRDLLDHARREAAEQGDPGRPDRREPELIAVVEPAGNPVSRASLGVRLLGGFAVERAGIDVSPPPGRPATLVKLLALRPILTPDEVIDTLWPEVDVANGRARLRNVLHRVRTASGALIDRTPGGLRLAPSVEVDAVRFAQEATAALGAPAEERAGLARSALARFAGELLPADRYADWAAGPRERLRRVHLALVDLVADDAIARGELDEACRLLDTAIAEDPLEEDRYLRLARALLAQSRPRRAREVVNGAVAVADDLGVEPGPELLALRDELLG